MLFLLAEKIGPESGVIPMIIKYIGGFEKDNGIHVNIPDGDHMQCRFSQAETCTHRCTDRGSLKLVYSLSQPGLQ
jgi:hypothetical protein